DQMQGNPFVDVIRMLPVIPVYDANNSGGFGYGSDKAYTFGTNPVAINNLVQADRKNVRLMGNAFAELKPVKWLTYKLNFGLETSFGHNQNLRKFGNWTYNQTVDPSRLEETRDQYLSKLLENTVNMNHNFGKHHLNGVVGTSYRIVTREVLGASKQDVTMNSSGVYYPEINAAINNPLAEGFSTRFLTFSYLGRVNYDFDSRYLLSATFRRDADSRFGGNYRHGNFPSLSAAWRLSAEEFFNAPWVSDLKLRASYGELGTSNIDPYERFGVVNLFPIAVFGNGQVIQNGAIQTQLVNEDIRWETKKTTNFGVDAAFLDNKVLFSAEYFISRTYDVLTPLPIPATTGNRGGNPFVNAASLENRGMEFAATYRNNDNPFKFDVSANLSTVQNKVIELGNLGEGITYISTALTRTQIGRPIGEYFLYLTDGLFQNQEEIDAHKAQPWAKPGDIRFKDVDGNGVLNAQDRTFAGSPWPTLQAGLGFNSSFRDFSFSAQFYGVAGNQIFSSARATIDRFNDNSNYRSGIVPWTPENPNTDFPRIAYNGEPGIASNTRNDSDRWLESGSYLRLRNVELGYQVPKQVLDKLRFTDTRLFVSGQNLLTLTRYSGLDPDVVGNGLYERGVDNGDYPPNRVISAGIQFGF
ncbi:MAG: SusC/RagA family TonB-linked outer membrane protein, partial [Adhaeribacter sp.]